MSLFKIKPRRGVRLPDGFIDKSQKPEIKNLGESTKWFDYLEPLISVEFNSCCATSSTALGCCDLLDSGNKLTCEKADDQCLNTSAITTARRVSAAKLVAIRFAANPSQEVGTELHVCAC